jgi:PAT family beta-lactamase induction signal transducer AmpG
VPALFVAIGLDNVGSGFAGTALIAYMSSLTAEGFTATQYALFSSLYALPGRLVASQSGALVEGAAQTAESGGAFSVFNAWFSGLPPESFAQSVERSGVGAAALGSGYVAFFIYSALVGVFAVVLTFIVASRRARAASETLSAKTAMQAPS